MAGMSIPQGLPQDGLFWARWFAFHGARDLSFVAYKAGRPFVFAAYDARNLSLIEYMADLLDSSWLFRRPRFGVGCVAYCVRCR